MVLWLSKDAKYEAKRNGDPVLLERKRARARKQYAENAAQMNAARTERHRANPERHAEMNKRFLHSDQGRAMRRRVMAKPAARERQATLMRERYVRTRGADVVERVVASVVLERAEGRCGICSLPVDPQCFHVDHIIPLARGGEHSYANTQPAHPICNLQKGSTLQEVA